MKCDKKYGKSFPATVNIYIFLYMKTSFKVKWVICQEKARISTNKNLVKFLINKDVDVDFSNNNRHLTVIPTIEAQQAGVELTWVEGNG